MTKTKYDPFWSKLIEAHDTIVMHPETEVSIEVGDKRATLFAKRNPETRELDVVIEVQLLKVTHAPIENQGGDS